MMAEHDAAHRDEINAWSARAAAQGGDTPGEGVRDCVTG